MRLISAGRLAVVFGAFASDHFAAIHLVLLRAERGAQPARLRAVHLRLLVLARADDGRQIDARREGAGEWLILGDCDG